MTAAWPSRPVREQPGWGAQQKVYQMGPGPGSADRALGPPFSGPGLLARVAPFALVAVAAEASLALPPGTHAWPAVTVSLILLALTGLSLQSVLSMVTHNEVRRRVEASATELDDAIRQLRQAIFGLENQVPAQGLRHRVLQSCADVSPVPEITFAGPVDDAVPAKDADRLLGPLRVALGLLGTSAGRTFVCVEAAERLSVTVTATGWPPVSANGDGSTRDLVPLRERARQDGIAIEVGPTADGTRLAWSVPLQG